MAIFSLIAVAVGCEKFRLSETLGLFPARAGKIRSMENQERDKEGGAGAGIFSMFGVIAVALVLYVLSAGLAITVLPRANWNVIYMPLAAVAYFVPPIGRMLMWYVNLWI
jgi:hypothetical protein